MTKNLIIKRIFIFVFLLISAFTSFNFAMATDIPAPGTLNNLDKAANKAYTGKDGVIDKNSAVGQDLPVLVGKIIGTGLSFLGVIFLVLMIYGGFLWMTDRGEGARAKKAKELIEAAIIGLIIVMSAYALTSWIGNKIIYGN